MPGWNAVPYIRKGSSVARGTTIDEYLGADDCAVLYERWQSAWPEPYYFRGGVMTITSEMVLQVPEDDFERVMGGRSKADRERPGRILAVARQTAGR